MGSTQKIEILVLGDTHIKDANREVVKQAISHLKEMEPVDYVVHLGDFWDKASGLKFEDLELAAELLNSLIRLARRKVFLVKGNHDLRKGSVHGLGIFDLVDRVEVVSTTRVVQISECTFVFLPYGVNENSLKNLVGDVAFGHLPLKGFRLTALSSKRSESGVEPKSLSQRFRLYFGGHHHIYEEKRNVVVVGSFLPTRRGEPSTCKYVVLEVDKNNVFWKTEKVSYQVDDEKSSASKARVLELATPEDVFSALDEVQMMMPSELREALLQQCTDECIRELVNEVCVEVGSWS